jgi:outer membrane protein OmpA-like peptidoglycan-associated protein
MKNINSNHGFPKRQGTVLVAMKVGAVLSVILLGDCSVFGAADSGRSAAGERESAKTNTFEVFFDFNRSILSEAGRKILQEAANSARQGNASGVTLAVHTDPAGPGGDDLARRRFDVVKAELVKGGMAADDIKRIGIDPADALASGSDGVLDPQNRRTEIILH